MLVWLASFPRSGNTVTRMLLHKAFGLQSLSLHRGGDDLDFPADSAQNKFVGHVSKDVTEEFLENARRSPAVHLVKTHLPPTTDDPAIYIVRDGRASTMSFYHYQKFRKYMDNSIQDVIAGRGDFGSWSSHFRLWDPLHRPQTLLLKFEEVLAAPEKAISDLGQFLKISTVGDFNVTFQELHKAAPNFFRVGDNQKALHEIAPYLGSFMRHHGQLMVELGYIDSSEFEMSLLDHIAELEAQEVRRAQLDRIQTDVLEIRQLTSKIESSCAVMFSNIEKLRAEMVRHQRRGLVEWFARRGVLRAQ